MKHRTRRRSGLLRATGRFALLAASAVLLAGTFTSPARAATITVCASGCDYTTIQAAVDAAATGDTISVAAGTYTGNVTIGKAVTLEGAKAGVPAGPGASPAGRSTASPYTGESVVDGELRIDPVSPGTVVIDRKSTRLNSSHT